MAKIQKITPHLWFAKDAEKAVELYTSVFKNSEISTISYYTEAGKEIHNMKPGSVMTIDFKLEGQRFMALNGGPLFKFNESISFMVNCETQEEIDYFWEKLKKGGDPKSLQCGWLKDKFGVSWQIVPSVMTKMMASKNPEKIENLMASFMKMKKLDIAKLEAAFNKK
jgi:predicted 3-demethylubiquinone-9 3-methyltransferase (glyoxalase superfamily)